MKKEIEQSLYVECVSETELTREQALSLLANEFKTYSVEKIEQFA
jgi:DNA-dependent RNA polymerase auxiliary subunit epsilon